MTTAEQIAHHESELRRLKAELDAERGLVEGEPCWNAWANGTVNDWPYCPESFSVKFPYTDDGKRKAERAAKMMASLNFEDPPFEKGKEVWWAWADGEVNRHPFRTECPLERLYWHQGRIHATEAEALAWRDKFNSAWTGGKS